MMRQAGRYLPEYRAVREKAGGFLDLCFNPELAAEVTLQPVRRFGFDAAILFSDILVIPLALGRKVWFVEGEGPRLEPLADAKALMALRREADQKMLSPIYETVRRVKAALEPQTALIGFCGAPWTVATYMVAGQGTPDQAPAKTFGRARAAGLSASDRLPGRGSVDYLARQLEAGAEWCRFSTLGLARCRRDDFERWCVQPTKQLDRQAAREKSRRQGDRLSARRRQEYSALCRGDRRRCGQPRQRDRPRLRARPDPDARAGAGQCRSAGAAAKAAPRSTAKSTTCSTSFGGGPLIFNLGHGILPDTPIAHVEQMLKRVRG